VAWGPSIFATSFALQETQIWLYICASVFDEEKRIGRSGPVRPRLLAAVRAPRNFAAEVERFAFSPVLFDDEIHGEPSSRLLLLSEDVTNGEGVDPENDAFDFAS
jgi:hypothetical protein